MKRYFRIRHCHGNKAAWMLVLLNAETKEEMDSSGSYITSLSLDALLRQAGHLEPKPGDVVELVV